jgi:hypothetical protein
MFHSESFPRTAFYQMKRKCASQLIP